MGNFSNTCRQNSANTMMELEPEILREARIPRSMAGQEYPNFGTKEGRWMRPGASAQEHRSWLSKTREFFIWLNHKGAMSHHSLGFSYITQDMETNVDKQRFLKVEIMYRDEPRSEVLLIYTGPGTADGGTLDLSNYSKKPKFRLKASISEVRAVSDECFDTFGSYSQYSNNCQHFVQSLENALQNEFKDTVDADLTTSESQDKLRSARSTETMRAYEVSTRELNGSPEKPLIPLIPSSVPTHDVF